MKAKLLASLMAAAFGFVLNGAFAQNADLQEPQTDKQSQPKARSVPGTADDAKAGDKMPDAAKNPSDIPGQSQGSVGHPDQGHTTGQGKGVIEQNAGLPKQPDTQVPEQSMGAVGHPEQGDITGKGDGVAERQQ